MNRELEQRWHRQQERAEDWRRQASRPSGARRDWTILLRLGPYVLGRWTSPASHVTPPILAPAHTKLSS